MATTERKQIDRAGAWQNRITGHGEEAPDQLLANPANWRIHPFEQQQALAAVLDEVGWVAEVIVNQTTGHVVDGHLRVSLAISKGEKTVPVRYVNLTEDEEKLVLATYDPMASLAVMDGDALANLLREVRPLVVDDALNTLLSDLAAQSDTALVSLDDLDPETDEKAPAPGLSRSQGDRLDELGRGVTEQDEAALEELRRRWATAPGQVWGIRSGHTPGLAHSLVIGDCTSPEARDAAVGKNYKNPQAVIVTSPPYGLGMSYESQFEGKMSEAQLAARERKGTGRGAGAGGKQTKAGEQEWESLMAAFVANWHSQVSAACINLAEMTVSSDAGYGRHAYGTLADTCEKYGWKFVATRIWHKGPVWGNNAYWLSTYKPVPEYEYIGLFADLSSFPVKRVSERVPKEEDWRFRSVWEFASVQSQKEAAGKHPAAYPSELPRRCILLLTDEGGTVVDPFLGSGTTMVVAEQLGRACVGLERDPLYAAMTLERMSRLGLSPEKVSG